MDSWSWIAGYRDGVWLPLYCFRPHQRFRMRGMLLALLTADEDSPLYEEHRAYEDFRIE